ncbi:hypothetical protein GGR56DRAFT_492880 [Xylariaceae sp. FL0804]|nr:hypothetical protein GGR56DRAFT_492880 [Xylariaceae sp. FL0804]
MLIPYRAPAALGGGGELDLAPNTTIAQLLAALRVATGRADIFVYCDYPPAEVKLYDGNDSPGEGESGSFNGFDETMTLAEVDLALEREPLVVTTRPWTQSPALRMNSLERASVVHLNDEPGSAMVLRRMPGDGDCLFHAVAGALLNFPAHGDVYWGEQLRQMTVDHIQAHPDAYRGWMAEQRLEEYCERMRRSGVWGGDIELRALARILGIVITVVDVGSDSVHEFGMEDSDDDDDKSNASHENTSHENTSHENTSHENTSHENTSHENISHENTSHEDNSHEDNSHENNSHENGNDNGSAAKNTVTSQGPKKRCILVYSGVHYDRAVEVSTPLAGHPLPSDIALWDVGVSDELQLAAVRGAMRNALRRRRYHADVVVGGNSHHNSPSSEHNNSPSSEDNKETQTSVKQEQSPSLAGEGIEEMDWARTSNTPVKQEQQLQHGPPSGVDEMDWSQAIMPEQQHGLPSLKEVPGLEPPQNSPVDVVADGTNNNNNNNDDDSETGNKLQHQQHQQDKGNEASSTGANNNNGSSAARLDWWQYAANNNNSNRHRSSASTSTRPQPFHIPSSSLYRCLSPGCEWLGQGHASAKEHLMLDGHGPLEEIPDIDSHDGTTGSTGTGDTAASSSSAESNEPASSSTVIGANERPFECRDCGWIGRGRTLALQHGLHMDHGRVPVPVRREDYDYDHDYDHDHDDHDDNAAGSKFRLLYGCESCGFGEGAVRVLGDRRAALRHVLEFADCDEVWPLPEEEDEEED